jgi:hypothetical protein
MDAWIYRLKAAYDAGYYKTEPAEAEQVRFPWQNRTCRDCPFWTNSICQLQEGYRSPTGHTCMFFDPWNRAEARAIIHERQQHNRCQKRGRPRA